MTKLLCKCLYVCTLALMLFLILTSCNPEKQLLKSYKKVAADAAPVNDLKKGIMAGWVLANFPQEQKVVTKDSVVNNYITSTKTDTVIVTENDIVYKYVYKTDTVTITKFKVKETTFKDTVGNWLKEKHFKAIADSFINYRNQYITANYNLNICNEKLSAANTQRNKLWLWIVLISLASIGSHILRNKLRV